MQATHVESIERTVQKTNEWLKAIAKELGTDSRQRAYTALRATLQSRKTFPLAPSYQVSHQSA